MLGVKRSEILNVFRDIVDIWGIIVKFGKGKFKQSVLYVADGISWEFVVKSLIFVADGISWEFVVKSLIFLAIDICFLNFYICVSRDETRLKN